MALVSIPRKGRCFVHANAFQGFALGRPRKRGLLRGSDTEFSAQQSVMQGSDPPSLLSVCTTCYCLPEVKRSERGGHHSVS